MLEQTPDIKTQLKSSIAQALTALGLTELPEIIVQETPAGKEGDYGTPAAMGLARSLRKAPPQIAAEIVEKLQAPQWVKRTFVLGGYLNFELDPAFLVQSATEPLRPFAKIEGKVLLEHTSVNPNKELHVGHLRNVCLGDSLARILRFAGRNVEVMNYIDDTGRQAAESLYALEYFGLGSSEGIAVGDGAMPRLEGYKKYDHFVGDAYVRLHQEMTDPEKKALIETGVQTTLHKLELGELREDVDKILRSQLQTMYRLGAKYDVIVWESDIVKEGLLGQALEMLKVSPKISRPTEGKYVGTMGFDASELVPGLEEPFQVLIRSNGTSTYAAKDIAFQYWKMGILHGLKFEPFEGGGETFTPGRVMTTSSPSGALFDHEAAHETINVIDVGQELQQKIVRASLEIAGYHDLYLGAYHLAYAQVTLDGQKMSGRRGIVESVDDVLDEAVRRAREIIEEKNPNHPAPDQAAEAVGVGAARFAMIKPDSRRIINFQFEQAVSFEGDTGPYIQYAYARAGSILRKAEEQGVLGEKADYSQATVYEITLAKTILRFPEIVQDAARTKAPHLMAQYLLELASGWSSFYNAKTPDGKAATAVLTAPVGLRGVRLELVQALRHTLKQGLELIGLQAPEVM